MHVNPFWKIYYMSQCGCNLFSYVPLGTYQQWWKWRVFIQGTHDCITIKWFAYWLHRENLGWHFSSKFHYPHSHHSIKVPQCDWEGKRMMGLSALWVVPTVNYWRRRVNNSTEEWRGKKEGAKDRGMDETSCLVTKLTMILGSVGSSVYSFVTKHRAPIRYYSLSCRLLFYFDKYFPYGAVTSQID